MLPSTRLKNWQILFILFPVLEASLLQVCLSDSVNVSSSNGFVMEMHEGKACRGKSPTDIIKKWKEKEIRSIDNHNDCLRLCAAEPKCKGVEIYDTPVADGTDYLGVKDLGCQLWTKQVQHFADMDPAQGHTPFCYVRTADGPAGRTADGSRQFLLARGSIVPEDADVTLAATKKLPESEFQGAVPSGGCNTVYDLGNVVSTTWKPAGWSQEGNTVINAPGVVGNACKESDWATCPYCFPFRSGTDAYDKFIVHNPSSDLDGKLTCTVEQKLETCLKLQCRGVIVADGSGAPGRFVDRDMRQWPAATTSQEISLFFAESSVDALAVHAIDGMPMQISLKSGLNAWASAAGGAGMMIIMVLCVVAAVATAGAAVFRLNQWRADSGLTMKEMFSSDIKLAAVAIAASVMVGVLRAVFFAACPLYSCVNAIPVQNLFFVLPGMFGFFSTTVFNFYILDLAKHEKSWPMKVLAGTAILGYVIFDAVFIVGPGMVVWAGVAVQLAMQLLSCAITGLVVVKVGAKKSNNKAMETLRIACLKMLGASGAVLIAWIARTLYLASTSPNLSMVYGAIYYLGMTTEAGLQLWAMSPKVRMAAGEDAFASGNQGRVSGNGRMSTTNSSTGGRGSTGGRPSKGQRGKKGVKVKPQIK